MAVTGGRGAVQRLLGRLAVRAPAPVFALAGPGWHDAVEALRLDQRVRLVDSPRHATVLLVAGELPPDTADASALVHDGLPRPRATVWWGPAEGDAPGGHFRGVEAVPAGADVAATLAQVSGELLTGARASDPPLLPDVDPVEWRGKGPYGHGGAGMTGGTPFGRPMADRAPDRDGLALDVVPITVGPFFPALPPGLTLRVTFQGDVIHELEVRRMPWWRARSESGRIGIAELEVARARQHLRWLAHALRLQGLAGLGLRALALAEQPGGPDRAAAERMVRMVRRLPLRWMTRGLGRLSADDVAGHGLGVVARASGVVEDARVGDPAYAALGFEPVLRLGGDACARMEVRLDEIGQSLELASRSQGAAPAVTEPAVQDVPHRLQELLPRLLVGLEWGEAVTAVTSLDLRGVGAPAPAAVHP